MHRRIVAPHRRDGGVDDRLRLLRRRRAVQIVPAGGQAGEIGPYVPLPQAGGAGGQNVRARYNAHTSSPTFASAGTSNRTPSSPPPTPPTPKPGHTTFIPPASVPPAPRETTHPLPS